MTIEETREQLKDLIHDRESFIITEKLLRDGESFTVSGDDEIYRKDIETLEKALEILEKQIPKKPLAGIDFMGNEFRICCKCSAIVKDGEWRANYCPDCGQAIDWSENNE